MQLLTPLHIIQSVAKRLSEQEPLWQNTNVFPYVVPAGQAARVVRRMRGALPELLLPEVVPIPVPIHTHARPWRYTHDG